MQIKPLTSLFVLVCLSAPIGASDESIVYIVSPADGATVGNPVRVIFGLRGPFGIAPAGMAKDNTGHHHLLIDSDLPDLRSPIPKDEKHRHFGGGQTETVIELSPGEHTLQLLLGDFAHIPHVPPMVSERITIVVE